MPMYDYACQTCQAVVLDIYEPVIQTGIRWCACGGHMSRAWVAKPPAVISDECDIWVKHGICNEDGTPRHYRFKSEMRAEAKRRGLVNHVEHIASPGSDKNTHGFTSRWV